MPQQMDIFKLPASTSSISLARGRTCRTLEHWGVSPDLRTQALLVLSELATNAVKHGSTNGCRFEVALSLGGTLRIEVSDADSTRKPALHSPTSIADHGRGLVIVDLLTTKWGTELHPPMGKTVWAELEAAAPACHTKTDQ